MIIKLFEEQVEQYREKLAVVTDEARLTYGELNGYANRVARKVAETNRDNGGTDAVIGLLFEHSADMVVGVISALKAEKAYLPLDVNYPENRLIYMLENSGACLLLTNTENYSRAKEVTAKLQEPLEVINIDEIDQNLSSGNPQRTPSGERLAYILYTSGSTGRPKGVVQNNENVLYYIRNWTDFFSITSRDRMTLFSAFSHDGAGQDMFGALLNGATLYPYNILNRANIAELAQWLRDEEITIYHSVPTLYRYFAETLTNPETANNLFPHLRFILLGGEPIREHDLAMFNLYFPNCRFANVYGQTESSVSTIWVVKPGEPVNKMLIGDPLDETEILLVNEDDEIVEEMGVGEIVVACKHIALGYWKDEENTERVFDEDPDLGLLYSTGDLGRLMADGSIEIMGRRDAQVKIRGFRVEVGEIETAMLGNEAIKEVAVVPKTAESGNILLYAYYVPQNGDGDEELLSVSQLREHLSASVPEYMIPSYFIRLEELPLTPNGKLDRKRLPEPQHLRPHLGVNYVAPQDNMENRIAEIWKEVLDLDKVGVKDNFFDLGGTSFDILKIMRRLYEEFDRDVPVVSIFRYPTISDFAAYLRDGESGGAEPGKEKKIGRDVVKQTQAGDTSFAVAVIGMAARFPGAPNVDAFLENIREGVESITFFDKEELRAKGVDPGVLDNPDHVPAFGVLEGIENFDSVFFGYSPLEAEAMDPQLRQLHECSWEALENAGYGPGTYDGDIGVYAGNAPNQYWVSLTYFNNKYTLDTVFLNNNYSTKISYKLNLSGPSVIVQTACSTSLVAVHLACRGLVDGECDMALAGGSSVALPDKTGYRYQEGMILSPDGHCRAFDAEAGGTIFGNGVGMVVLKGLDEAVRDNDTIYAVVRGTAINNDGSRKVGLTAPSVEGQADVIRTAQQLAGFEPESIGYIEAHGTGTVLGDPIEVEALKLAFNTDRKGYCAIGSVKPNVGHLNSAAGIAGFIKTVLTLHHKFLPPTLHFKTPNPQIDFANSPFYVSASLKEWSASPHPRRAGVSAFGIGGTNAHALLEEYPTTDEANNGSVSPKQTMSPIAAQSGVQGEPPPGARRVGAPGGPPEAGQLILLSAKNKEALDRASVNFVEYVGANPGMNFADAAYTLQVGRRGFKHRRMLVCSGVEDVKALPDSPSFIAETDEPAVVFLFPGQGAQYVDMGRELYEGQPFFREEVDRCFAIFSTIAGYDLKPFLYPGEGGEVVEEGAINRTQITQPVIFIFEYALARLLMHWGIKPYAMMGHSIGEYAAACISGVFSLEDALKLVILRGESMQRLPGGGMLSVTLPEKQLSAFLEEHKEKTDIIRNIDLAAVNSSSHCVVSGPHEAIDGLAALLESAEIQCRKLVTSHAFHSRMMEPALEEFESAAGGVIFNKPAIPYVSNVTGKWISVEESSSPQYWASHLRQAVRFSDGLSRLLDRETALFVEVGPGRGLSTFVRQHEEKQPRQQAINLVRHPKEKQRDMLYLLDKIGRLWLSGQAIDWEAFHRGEGRGRVPLPTYPFQSIRYWMEGASYRTGLDFVVKESAAGTRKELSDWFYLPTWKQATLPGTFSVSEKLEAYSGRVSLKHTTSSKAVLDGGPGGAFPWPAGRPLGEPPEAKATLPGTFSVSEKLDAHSGSVSLKHTTSSKAVLDGGPGGAFPWPAGRPLGEPPEANGFSLPGTFSENEPGMKKESPAPQRWLIFTDGSSMAEVLRGSLEQLGHEVFTVVDGGGFEAGVAGERRYTVNFREEEDVRSLFKLLKSDGQLPHRILYLPLLTLTRDAGRQAGRVPSFQEEEAFLHQCLEAGFYNLLALARVIGELEDSFAGLWDGNGEGETGETEGLRLGIITSGAAAVVPGEPLEPAQGAVTGVINVVSREYPVLRCCGIDLPAQRREAEEETQLAGDIVDVIDGTQSAQWERLVALRRGRRWFKRVEPLHLENNGLDVFQLREKGVYLVTGGLGALGFHFAGYLARQFRARLIFTDLQSLPPREEWEQWLEPGKDREPVAAKIRQVKSLESAGAEVAVYAADVTDVDQMAEAISLAEERFGPINGVIHTAGRAGGGLIQIRDRQLSESVLAPKTRGVLVLDHLLGQRKKSQIHPQNSEAYSGSASSKHTTSSKAVHSGGPGGASPWPAGRPLGEPPEASGSTNTGNSLDFFILFSSVSALLAPVGQVAYSAANAFMDTFAQSRNSVSNVLGSGPRFLSINWDNWREIGMAVRALENSLKGNGGQSQPAAGESVTPVFQDAGELIFPHPLLQKHERDFNGADIFAVTLDARRDWVLDDHRVMGKAVLPGTAYLELVTAALRNLPVSLPLQVESLFLLAPLQVDDQQAKELRVRVHADGEDRRFSVIGREQPGEDSWVEYARGNAVPLAAEEPRRHDIAQLESRCHQREISFEEEAGLPHSEAITFGPRWKNLYRVRFGDGEAFGELRLTGDLADDVNHFKLHPALLDVGNALMRWFDETRAAVLPIYYGNVKIFGDIPARVFFHVRALEGSDDRSSVRYHVTIMDETGREIAEIEDYTLRILETAPTASAQAEASSGKPISHFIGQRDGDNAVPGEAGRSQIDKLLETAISPDEGLDAFARILGRGGFPQVVVSTVDFCQRLKEGHTPTAEADAEDAGQTDSGPKVSRPQLSTPYVAPSTPMEATLAAIWEELLGIEPVGIEDDFFELGGDSLKAVTFAGRIRKETHTKVPIAEFFNRPTVKKLAQYVTHEGEEHRFEVIPRAEKQDFYPLSPAQRRLFILQQMETTSVGYNLSFALVMEGNVSVSRVQDVLEQLILRHESLRTSFTVSKGKPVQQIHETAPLSMETHDLPAEEVTIAPGDTSPLAGRPELSRIIKGFYRPFDLSVPPLMRAGWVPLEENRFILLLDFHHIIFDGTSTGLFFNDFLAIFSGKELPGLTHQYKDYCTWFDDAGNRAARQSQEDYWVGIFNDEIPILNCPADFERPVMQSFQGKRLSFSVDAQQTAALRKAASSHDATLFMVLLAAINIFAARISGQEDVVVGSPVAGRNHTDLENIIGVFINTLPLRNFPRRHMTVRQFLGDVKNRTLEAFGNQDYPFEELVEKVDVRRDTSRNPLFDILFRMQNFAAGSDGIPQLEAGGLKIKGFDYEPDKSVVDLHFTAVEAGETIYFALEYCTRIFREESVRRFIRYFEKILAAVAASDGQTLGTLDIIPAEEREQLLVHFNDTVLDYPFHLPLHHLFDEQVQRTPDAVAVIGKSSPGVPGTLTYAALKEKADALAASLSAKGVGPGSVVALMVERNTAMMAGLLAVLKTGAAYLPMDPTYPQSRVAYVLEKSGARVLLTQENLVVQPGGSAYMEGFDVFDIFAPRLYEGAVPSDMVSNTWNHGQKSGRGNGSENTRHRRPAKPCNMGVQGAPPLAAPRVGARGAPPEADSGSRNMAYVIYTSGSTGNPKGVMVSHRNAVNFIAGMCRLIDFEPGSAILALTTISFDIFFLETLLPLTRGLTVIVADENQQRDPRALKELIETHNVNMLQATPSRLQMLLNFEEAHDCLARLDSLLVGGEAFPGHLFARVKEICKGSIFNVYGPTETTIWSTVKDLTNVEPGDLTIGRPIANTQIYIVDKNLHIQPLGVSGELLIGGDGVALGYQGNETLTTEKFIPSPFIEGQRLYRTGDLARWLPNGDIQFLGRSDHQVKVRGFRVELEEIEEQLLNQPGIKEAVVIAAPGRSGDTRLAAYLVPESGEKGETDENANAVEPSEPDTTTLRENLALRLPDYMIPSFFIPMKKIPLTPNGKVDRKALPEPDVSKQIKGKTFVAPQSSNEKAIAEIWKEVLELEAVGINDNFFDLGGTSLNVIQLSWKLKETFGKEIPAAELFRNLTISYLNDYFSEAPKQTEQKEQKQTEALNKARKSYKDAIKKYRRQK